MTNDQAIGYWRKGTEIIEACLAKARAADPQDVPMPLVGNDAKLWHQAQAEAYRHALEMMAPPGKLDAARVIPFSLADWAARHGVTAAALDELRMGIAATLPPPPPPDDPSHTSEAYVQSLVRLEAPGKGVRLFRNNSGALLDEGGRLVRFGLGNDSKAVNDVLKSPDLFGWRAVVIRPEHVGRVIAQAVGRECKPTYWKFSQNDARAVAQQTFGNLLLADGGDFAFTTGPGSL